MDLKSLLPNSETTRNERNDLKLSLPIPLFRTCRNLVVRDVRDSYGNKLGTVIEPHDGTETGVILAAQRVTDKMYAEYPEASNIQSRMGATDKDGNPAWSISPTYTQAVTPVKRDAQAKIAKLLDGRSRSKARHADNPIAYWTLMDPDSKRGFRVSSLESWRPRRDLNPCYRRERAMS